MLESTLLASSSGTCSLSGSLNTSTYMTISHMLRTQLKNAATSGMSSAASSTPMVKKDAAEASADEPALTAWQPGRSFAAVVRVRGFRVPVYGRL
jgi:hypothetical protein